MALRVLLADDHRAVREGLRALLEREGVDIVAEAADGRAAVESALKLHPDAVVLDVAMPLLNGLDAAREITRAAPRTAAILLTALDDARLAREALRAGVRGLVTKTQGVADLLQAIEETCAGGLYLSPGASQAVVDVCVGAEDLSGGRLTPREREVLRLLAEGKSTKQIAGQLSISVKTAEFHRARIREKLKIGDTAGLVRYAIREGIVTA